MANLTFNENEIFAIIPLVTIFQVLMYLSLI